MIQVTVGLLVTGLVLTFLVGVFFGISVMCMIAMREDEEE